MRHLEEGFILTTGNTLFSLFPWHHSEAILFYEPTETNGIYLVNLRRCNLWHFDGCNILMHINLQKCMKKVLFYKIKALNSIHCSNAGLECLRLEPSKIITFWLGRCTNSQNESHSQKASHSYLHCPPPQPHQSWLTHSINEYSLHKLELNDTKGVSLIKTI